MKFPLFPLLALLLLPFPSMAQDGDYALELEVVSEDVGILVGALGVTDLSGYSCTRLYVTMANTDDFMSSVSGDANNPTYVNTTTNFYHAILGGITPNGINSLLFAVYPDMQYDSWVTIGLQGVPNAAAGEAAVSTVQSTSNPWATNFDLGGGLPGANIEIDDAIGGAWYALNGDANGVAGDDLKVLIGQFTTTGELSGQVYCQVFINGDGAQEYRETFYFGAGSPVFGCTDPEACNFNVDATDDDETCEFPLTICGADNLDCACNCLADADGDGICDEDEIPGCIDGTACNYDAGATDDDGTCEYALPGLDCNGNCLEDADGDGICDGDEIAGCTDAGACNFDGTATDDDGTCEFLTCAGCTDASACNYDGAASLDDGSCTYPDAANLDCDGNCLNDADADGICDEDELGGCTDMTACNYDAAATDDDGSCTYADAGLDCDGNCLEDADGDGICDGDEILGCTDAAACNFSIVATDEDGSCYYPDPGYDCNGNCLEDADGDGVCDADEVAGCTEMGACNYDAAATDDDGSCDFAAEGLDCDGNCLEDADGDGVCDADEVAGCTDMTACNYDTAATDDDGSCDFAAEGLDCDGNCLEDADGDGVCDADEVAGCTDPEAGNFDAAATDDDGSCEYGCGPGWGSPIILPSPATVLALVTVDGSNADMDDQVGAFVNGELRGVGSIIDYEGATYINMTVYLNGSDETLTFELFNADECSTCAMDAELVASGFGSYGSFDMPLMFNANCSVATLEVSLNEGWNYVSTNVIPENYSISSLFEDALGGSLLKVLGDDQFALGQSYTPGIPSVFNSLQMHSDAAGYVIKVDAAGTWTSTGIPLDAANTPLDLNEGWNIIGYVPQAAMDVEEALASIDGIVGTVIDGQSGTVWNPANPNEFNTLLDLEPGRSYWLRMIGAATLTYPDAAIADGGGMEMVGTRADGNPAETMTGWSVVRMPGAAAVAVEVLLDESPVDGEAYLGAFIGETCVAARTVIPHAGGSATQMAIMLNGPSEVEFKLWVDGMVHTSSDILVLEAGDERGQGGELLPIIRFGSETNAVATPSGLSGAALAPMPAQVHTWLELELAAADRVKIEVFDARGARIAILNDGLMPAGHQRIGITTEGWATGTYVVRGTGGNGRFHLPLIVE